jgi:RND superfamily putative drug exporter
VGLGTDAFGLGQAGPVEAFLPVVTLAILFGLSMDYQVFLVSRMNEEWVHGRRNSVAVRTGQGETARVITAAATIMISVFLTFSFMGQRDVAEFGIGLAVAVALDAFILRTVLMPAAMHPPCGWAGWNRRARTRLRTLMSAATTRSASSSSNASAYVFTGSSFRSAD